MFTIEFKLISIWVKNKWMKNLSKVNQSLTYTVLFVLFFIFTSCSAPARDGCPGNNFSVDILGFIKEFYPKVAYIGYEQAFSNAFGLTLDKFFEPEWNIAESKTKMSPDFILGIV